MPRKSKKRSSLEGGAKRKRRTEAQINDDIERLGETYQRTLDMINTRLHAINFELQVIAEDMMNGAPPNQNTLENLENNLLAERDQIITAQGELYRAYLDALTALHEEAIENEPTNIRPRHDDSDDEDDQGDNPHAYWANVLDGNPGIAGMGRKGGSNSTYTAPPYNQPPSFSRAIPLFILLGMGGGGMVMTLIIKYGIPAVREIISNTARALGIRGNRVGIEDAVLAQVEEDTGTELGSLADDEEHGAGRRKGGALSMSDYLTMAQQGASAMNTLNEINSKMSARGRYSTASPQYQPRRFL